MALFHVPFCLDWEGLIMKQQSNPAASTSQTKEQKPLRKLSKSAKKKIKLEKQAQEFQDTLKKNSVETVVYDNPDAISNQTLVLRKPHQGSSSEVNKANNSEQEGEELDMKKTRYEIMKFGMKSLSSQELVDAETSLAISLGAKPGKRPAVNYKELQAQRKKERDMLKSKRLVWLSRSLKV